ncbi:MAG TPA: type II secretion system protein [Candidatus Paceibacterota bacterium]
MKNKGFTLLEIVIVIAIASAIFMAVFYFGESIFSWNSASQKNLSAQSDARKILKTITRELRSASPSSLGAYPLSQAGASSVTFFSNVDDEPDKEQIRYFLDGNELKRGVIKPSGFPLTYNPANENLSTLIRDINNGLNPVFEYFDSTYTGASDPLLQPVQPTQVRLVRITVYIEKDPNKSLGPVVATSQVFLRNLKDNL